MKPPYDRKPKRKRGYEVIEYINSIRDYFGWKRHKQGAIQEGKKYLSLEDYVEMKKRD